jgi:hypothetical protein
LAVGPTRPDAGDADAMIPLGCDYVWSDPTQDETWTGTYQDNTFNLQRDWDTLSVYVGDPLDPENALDVVTWSYDDVEGYWPRDAQRSLQLDPALLDDVLNDDIASWCSTASDPSNTWWTDGTDNEYGNPGWLNPSCT